MFTKTMNKTIALAAIVMVAVVMGMSAFAPTAMAVRGVPSADFVVCHRGGVATPDDGSDDEWVVMNLPNQRSLDKHVDHGDVEIAPTENVSAANCPGLPITWSPTT